MDPIMKAWMFHNWFEDFGDEYKLLENQGILIGSFIDPEAAKKMLGVGREEHSSSDEEFEEVSRKIAAASKAEQEGKKKDKRRRRKVKE
jgi:hypothetical protein